MTQQDLTEKLRRQAIRFQVGGFKPDESLTASWFGKVLVGKKGEEWPESNGNPMIPICQLNIKELSFKSENIKDIEFITLFVDAEELPYDTPNEGKWLIRTYSKLEDLIRVEQPKLNTVIKPFQLKPEVLENDFPCWENCPIEIPEEYDENYYELFPNIKGIKIGGWPSLVQSEIFWAPLNQHPAEPEYVLQIDSVEKANWFWGDNGVAYIGRGTKEGRKDEWVFSWQCY